MSDAPSLADQIAARLERLAEMDLAAAEHVHAQLMAADEPKAVAELARAYQRHSRTLRQTLMLQMKHAREEAAETARAASRAETRMLLSEETAVSRFLHRRTRDLQDAIGRVAYAAHPDSPRRQRDVLDRLDVEIDEWADDEDFYKADLDDAVSEACERLDLPMALGRQWESLPRPAQTFDPASAPPPPVPSADTG